jgi:hypothetical protein
MKPETWVAIYAAVVGTGALLLNFKNWLDSGIKLKLSIIPDGVIFGGDPQFDEKDVVIVTVINRGDAATMISGMYLHQYPSQWRRWRRRPSKAYVVPNPQLKGYPSNTPSDLEPAKTWTGVIRHQEKLIPDLHTGQFYVAVAATHRDQPHLIRIPPKKPKRAIEAKPFE